MSLSQNFQAKVAATLVPGEMVVGTLETLNRLKEVALNAAQEVLNFHSTKMGEIHAQYDDILQNIAEKMAELTAGTRAHCHANEERLAALVPVFESMEFQCMDISVTQAQVSSEQRLFGAYMNSDSLIQGTSARADAHHLAEMYAERVPRWQHQGVKKFTFAFTKVIHEKGGLGIPNDTLWDEVCREMIADQAALLSGSATDVSTDFENLHIEKPRRSGGSRSN